jgi:hypothetical protein
MRVARDYLAIHAARAAQGSKRADGAARLRFEKPHAGHGVLRE